MILKRKKRRNRGLDNGIIQIQSPLPVRPNAGRENNGKKRGLPEHVILVLPQSLHRWTTFSLDINLAGAIGSTKSVATRGRFCIGSLAQRSGISTRSRQWIVGGQCGSTRQRSSRCGISRWPRPLGFSGPSSCHKYTV